MKAKIILALLAAVASMVTSASSYAQIDRVEIIGIRDCSGIISAECGWDGYEEIPGVGGGDLGAPPQIVTIVGQRTDDGSRGKTMDNNRFTPGCQREDLFMEEVIANVVASNEPQGQRLELAGPINDPLFRGGGWEKYDTARISRVSSPTSFTHRYEMRIHYMYNQSTNQIAQVKLKNSYESGCLGFRVV